MSPEIYSGLDVCGEAVHFCSSGRVAMSNFGADELIKCMKSGINVGVVLGAASVGGAVLVGRWH
jgi:hypothetical protein